MNRPLSLLALLALWEISSSLQAPAIAADLPPATTTSSIQASNFEPAFNIGLQAYQSGQYHQALTHWQTLLDARGDTPSLEQARLLTHLGFAHTQLGQWTTAENILETSLKLLASLPNSDIKVFLTAQTVMGQGHLAYMQGHLDEALSQFETADRAYSAIADRSGAFHSRINQAKVLHSQGYNLLAQESLTEIEQNLATEPPSPIKVEVLRELGNLLQFTEGSEAALEHLRQSLEVATELQDNQQIALSAFDRGNLLYKQGETTKAETDYETVLAHTTDPSLRLQVWVNRWYFWVQGQQAETLSVRKIRQGVEAAIAAAPRDRTSLYARISDSRSLLKWQQQQDPDRINYPDLAARLATAIQGARQIQDAAAESYGLGHLAFLYEQQGQSATALHLTQQALDLAQLANAKEVIYQWQWQQGQILWNQEEFTAAEQAYEAAIATLEALRGDLSSLQGETRFSFREEVEPVYRQYVSLLLTPRNTTAQYPSPLSTLTALKESAPKLAIATSTSVSQENLRKARQAIESLQLAELVLSTGQKR